jgi:hypothetical protein
VSVLDHLVYATPDVAATVDELERALGVRPSPGGRFEAFGAMNHLLAVGVGMYLEVIGPDPTVPEPAMPRPFGIDELPTPALVTWAARTDDIDAAVDRARAAGYDPGTVLPLSRAGADGALLEWRLTLRSEVAHDGLVPFLIDWGTSPHPSTTAVGSAELVEWRGMHPDPAGLRAALAAVEVDLPIERAEQPALVARLRGPAGEVTLSR